MTLCIAASCMDGARASIVTSTDWKIEAGGWSVENTDKTRNLTENWVALLAGPFYQADEIARLYEQHLSGYGACFPLQEADFLDWLKRPFSKYKRQSADEYLQRTYGHSFSWLEAEGKNKLPEDVHRQRLSEIEAHLPVQAELIIAGITPRTPTIASVDCYGVRYEPNFAAVGSGDSIAKAFLSYRRQESDCSLAETVYNVYEAQTLGAIIAPGVGSDLTVRVLTDGRKPRSLNDKGLKEASKYYKKLGPRQPREGFEFQFDKNCFDRDG